MASLRLNIKKCKNRDHCIISCSQGAPMLADALNKEEIIFPCTNNLAAVFVSAQHWGAGLGTFDSVQTDYFRDPGAI